MLDRQLGPYTIVAPLGAGGWARSIARATASSVATSRSRSCRRTSRPTPSVVPASRAKRACSPRSTIRTSARSTDWRNPMACTALVLELVEGPTLAERLERGTAADRRGARDCAPDRRGARRRAREGHRPSRSEAGQHRAARLGQRRGRPVERDARESARLRPRQDDGRRSGGRPDPAAAGLARRNRQRAGFSARRPT